MIKIYGKNCLNEAIVANAPIEEVFVDEQVAKKEAGFLHNLEVKGIKYSVTPHGKMDSLFGSKHQGFGAYRKDYFIYPLSTVLEAKPKRRVLILDGIQDPHNFGAILRSCDAFGVDAVILPNNRSVSITETVSHVSTGAIEFVKIIYVNNLNNTVKALKDNGYWIVGTDAKGQTTMDKIDLSLDLAIIIGSEGFGMSKILVNSCDFLLSIPMCGHVNSLNASVSTGIVLQALCK